MGVVYETFDRVRKTRVALKTLNRIDAQNIYRMKQEFRALADVSHPNLAQLYELVFEDGIWFFTMELVDGRDLLAYTREDIAADEALTLEERAPDTLLKNRPPVPKIEDLSWGQENAAPFDFSTVGEAVPQLEVALSRSTRKNQPKALGPHGIQRTRDALRQLAEGMLALHDANKLHRDIKPSNVMVAKNGRVVLLDFGLVTELYEEWLIKSTLEGVVAGTIAYMAPEQGAGMLLTPASDWYSVGVMLFEALTRCLPFEGRLFDVLLAKQSSDPPRPRDLVPDVPADLDQLAFELLQRDPALRPDGRAVLERLGGSAESVMSIASWNNPSALQDFVGRQRELQVLDEALAGVLASRKPAVVHLYGRSGSGKSALVRRFIDRQLSDEKTIAFASRCYERELVPYKAMDSVIDTLSRYLRKLGDERVKQMLGPDARALSRMFPVLMRVETIARASAKEREVPDPLELRRRAFAALGALFSEIAARPDEGRLPVIFIDDAQWGDVDSAALLGEMLGSAHPPPVLLVLSYRMYDRGGGPGPLVRALNTALADADLSIRELELGPLTSVEAEFLAWSLLAADRKRTDLEGRAKAIAHESAGVPLLVQELASFGGDALGLDDAMAERFRGLPADAQRLLAVIAVAARPIEVGVAQRTAGLEAEDRSVMSLLRSHRLVRLYASGHGEEVELSYERIAGVVLKHRTTEGLRVLHVALVAELEKSEKIDPEALVLHLRAAGELRRAGDYAVRAARRAEEALAFDRAASLLEIGVQLAASSEIAEYKLRGLLGDALVKAGRGAEAADAYLEAAAISPEIEAVEMKRRAAESLLRSGYVDRGVLVIREVLSALGVTYPETHDAAYRMLAIQRLEMMVRNLRFRERPASEVSAEERMRIDALWSAATGLAMVDSIRAAYFHSRQMVLALRAGDPYRLARALSIEACIAGGSEANDTRGVRALSLLEELATKLDVPHINGLVLLAGGFMCFLRGEWSNAIVKLERSRTVFEERCSGVSWEMDTAQLLILSCLNYRGDLSTVPRRVQEALHEAALRKNRYIDTILRTSPNVSIAYAGVDRVDEAREKIDVAIARWSQGEFHLQHYHAVASHVLLDLYDGEYRRAWTRMEDAWERISATQLTRLALVRFESHYARARAALAAASVGHDTERLVELAREDAEAIAATGMRYAAPIAALVRAQVAAICGEAEEAERELEISVRGLEAAEMTLHRASAQARLGQLRGGAAGDALVVEAEAVLKARGVVDVDRFTGVFAPVRWG
jgi:serine/threonine protein kinase